MNSNRNVRPVVAVALAAVLALTLILAPAAGAAGNAKLTVIPPGLSEALTGMSYAQWSSAWWQWALSVGAAANPLLDKTGANCGEGQPGGDVFFLAGTSGGGIVRRDACNIPAGKTLFVPLVNFVNLHTPGDGLDTPEKLRQDLLSHVGAISNLHDIVDGKPIPDIGAGDTPYRVCAAGDEACAPAFNVTLPNGNLLSLPAGTYPAAAEGYYLMLAPLSSGSHTLQFGGAGAFAGSPVLQDITYNLNVAGDAVATPCLVACDRLAPAWVRCCDPPGRHLNGVPVP